MAIPPKKGPGHSGGRLESWKEIAAHLGSSVRTVQRWEKEEGLPVHRQQHAKQGSIYAFGVELDNWRHERSCHGAEHSHLDSARDGLAGAGMASASSSGAGVLPLHGEADWSVELDGLRKHLAASPPALELLDGHAGSTAPVVGRDGELARLVEAFAGAAQGQVGLLGLAGEAGAGKTTLFDAFLAQLVAQATSVSVARGRCLERLAGNEAYLPVLEALESLLRLGDGELIGSLMRLVAPTWYVRIAPLWATADPAFERVLEDAKTASRERMKRELLAFFVELSASRPVVLFFDDVHWADESTVETIAYLASSAQPLRLLLVSTYRGSELQTGAKFFLKTRRDLQARGFCHEVPVGFLAVADTAAYLDRAFPGHSFPASLTTTVHQRSDGNPLFLVDLLRHMHSTGVIEACAEAQSGARWRLSCPLEDAVNDLPESVRSAVERKLDRLDEQSRALLHAAAIQGAEFDSAVVAAVTDTEADVVEAALAELDRVHCFVKLVREAELPDGSLSLRYAFVHVLYQQALRDSLTPSRRVALSRAAAAALAAFYEGEQSLVAGELAWLFESARDATNAAEYFLLAAEKAAGLFANPEALALVQNGLKHAASVEGEQGFRQSLRGNFLRVRIFNNQARYGKVVIAARAAESAAESLGDLEAGVEAACGIANALFYLKRIQESLEVVQRAVALAERAGSAHARAAAEAAMARIRLSQGEVEPAVQIYDRVIPILRENPSLQALEAVAFRILTHAWRLEYRQAEEASVWWLREAKRQGLQAGQMHFFRGMALGNAGRLSDAIQVLREGMQLADLHEDTYHVCRLPNTLGWVYRLAGAVEDGLKLDEESRALAQELGFEEAEANAHVNLAHDYTQLGEFKRAYDHLESAERIFQDDVWFRWRYNIRLQLEKASYWKARGDLAVAASSAAAAEDLASRAKARKHMSSARCIRAEIGFDEDRIDDAFADFQLAIQYLDGLPCPDLEIRIYQGLSRVAAARKDSVLAEASSANASRLVASLADSIHDDALRATFWKTRES